jgi:hypothetical protein
VVLILVSSLSCPRWGAAQGQRTSPLDIRVTWAPSPFISNDRAIAAYELRVTNVSGRDLVLVGVQITRDSARGRVVQSLRGDSLLGAIVPVGARDSAASAALLRSGRQAIVFLWQLAGGREPGTLALFHRLLVVRADSLAAVPDTVGPVELTVQLRAPHVLDAPLEGGPWLARNGPGNSSDHRRTLISVNGVSRIAQRFATDWIKLGPDYRMWKGDSTVNRNWYGYGAAVRAVGAGIVVATHDGIRENIALSEERATPITLETAAGNYVIQQVGAGQFALYAHLQPGSLRVKVGQRVRTGAQLGLLGNSGNSGAPHLHVHLMQDSATPLGGEGLPFSIREYVSEGTLSSLDELFGATPWRPQSTVRRRGELPTENMIVRFPADASVRRSKPLP